MNLQDKQKLMEIFKFRGWTLGLAESCTGGLVSSQWTALPGVSAIYNGGVVSYRNEIKEEVLGVPHTMLQTYGPVSYPVAKAMAWGAKDLLKSHVALSVTGLAGPAGGTASQPVGLVFIAVVGPGFEKVERHVFTSSNGAQLSRQEIQNKAAHQAWVLLDEVMNLQRIKSTK